MYLHPPPPVKPLHYVDPFSYNRPLNLFTWSCVSTPPPPVKPLHYVDPFSYNRPLNLFTWSCVSTPPPPVKPSRYVDPFSYNRPLNLFAWSCVSTPPPPPLVKHRHHVELSMDIPADLYFYTELFYAVYIPLYKSSAFAYMCNKYAALLSYFQAISFYIALMKLF